jgi:hypothetical protein
MPARHIGEGLRTGTHAFAKKWHTTKYIRSYCLSENHSGLGHVHRLRCLDPRIQYMRLSPCTGA